MAKQNPNLEIKVTEFTPEMIDKNTPKSSTVIKHIVPQQLYRTRQDIQTWRLALSVAENIHNPNRTELYRGYQDSLLDAHIKAVIDQRHAEVLAKPFEVVDNNGTPLEDWTEKFNRNAMVELYGQILTSVEWGFTLVQLCGIEDDTFISSKVVPREYVKPENGIVADHPGNNEGVSFEEGKFSAWTLPVGEKKDLGLLLSIMPLYIYKKNSVGNWAGYNELFGQPTRVLKSMQTDQGRREETLDQLANMGSTPYMMIDDDEELEIHESSTGSGYNTFKEYSEFLDAQISKCVLGQTMTSDNGSSQSQANVHAETLNTRTVKDTWFLEATINDVLIPKMKALGVAFPEGAKFKIVDKEKVNQGDKFQRVLELVRLGVPVPNDFITEEFNIPIEDFQEEVIDTKGAQTDGKELVKGKAQKETSYNGAQIASAMDILNRVALGELTPKQGKISLMEFLKLDESTADSLMADTSKAKPQPTPAPQEGGATGKSLKI
jgi:hypothetical protein